MTVMQYRRASDLPPNPWPKAVEQLRDFQKKYDAVMKLRDEDLEKDSTQKILGEFAFLKMKNDACPTVNGEPFAEWLKVAFMPGELHPNPHQLRPEGSAVMMVADGKVPLSKFQDAVRLYADAMQRALDLAAPERFSYSGFNIENEFRMGDLKCRKLLEGVDYLVGLFKRRGLSHLLSENVRKVEIVPDLSDNTLGLYHQQTKDITISWGLFRQGGPGRFMEWVKEVFLHEFGHHVHLSILPQEAKAVWDSGWSEVVEKKEALERAFKTISRDERVRYYEVMKKSAWDPSRAAKSLSAADKVKFGVWLRSPMSGEPLITEKQFRLTARGRYIAHYMLNPEEFMKKHYDLTPSDDEVYQKQSEQVAKRIADNLGLLYAGNYSIPSEVVDELSKSDPTIQKAVEEALDKLEIVSPYGKTNEKEDFAESFVAFVDAPEKLTPTAKFRMQRCLSIAGLYGKPVMKLAFRVLDRYKKAYFF